MGIAHKRKEENMKKMKKILAMLLAVVMVMGMSLTVFAEESGTTTGTKPTDGDKLSASVTNIKQEGVTVKAYQVVKANYNDNGFTGYSWVDATGYNAEGDGHRDLFTNVTGADNKSVKTLNIDQDTIVALANMAKNSALGEGIPMIATSTGGTTYTAELPAGSYVVLVTGSNDIIYNPMLVGVYYTTTGAGNDNALVTEELDATSNWTLLAQNGFVKSSEPKVEKTIVDSGSGNDHGDDVAIGDTVSFRIDTQMPSYSAQYTDPKFNISDIISEGLTYKADTLKVYEKTETAEGEETLTEISEENYTVNPAFTPDSKTFKVIFATAYIKANQNQYIVIKYDAELNEKAGINFDANTNTAKLDENGTAVVEGETVTVTSPLEGAKFELRKKNEDGSLDASHVYAATSGKDGSLSFTGLDAGKYVLVETEAPAGYSLDPKEHDVEITAEYYTKPEENKGKLKSYTIKIDNEATSTYTATYTSSEGTKVTTIDKTQLGVTGIKNTKLAQLPSTGGIGTTIFTIGGCAIMIIAAGLFFATRRKAEK